MAYRPAISGDARNARPADDARDPHSGGANDPDGSNHAEHAKYADGPSPPSNAINVRPTRRPHGGPARNAEYAFDAEPSVHSRDAVGPRPVSTITTCCASSFIQLVWSCCARSRDGSGTIDRRAGPQTVRPAGGALESRIA